MTSSMPSDGTPLTTLYVSWGGTGRSASLRAAFREAVEQDASLVYLAILDDASFGDVDAGMLAVAIDELEWLLDAQINLTKTQVGAEDLAVRVIVRQGPVIDQIAATVETLGSPTILLGAPIPVDGADSVDAMVTEISDRTGQPVRIIEPAE